MPLRPETITPIRRSDRQDVAERTLLRLAPAPKRPPSGSQHLHQLPELPPTEARVELEPRVGDDLREVGPGVAAKEPESDKQTEQAPALMRLPRRLALKLPHPLELLPTKLRLEMVPGVALRQARGLVEEDEEDPRSDREVVVVECVVDEMAVVDDLYEIASG